MLRELAIAFALSLCSTALILGVLWIIVRVFAPEKLDERIDNPRQRVIDTACAIADAMSTRIACDDAPSALFHDLYAAVNEYRRAQP